MIISGKRPGISTMPFAVRPLEAADVLQAQEIEREAFPDHFPPTSFQRELQNRSASYLVATLQPHARRDAPTEPARSGPATADGVSDRLGSAVRATWAGLRPETEQTSELIAGFLGAWYIVDEAHVITVGIRRAYRGRGVGELLLIAAIEQAYAKRAATMTLEVRPSNYVARNLYSKYRFDVNGVRKAYYADDREDALIMSTGAIRDPSYRELFADAKEEHRRRWGRADLLLARAH
jgi:ribosomal-protein-alanine N-acetyltransferase